MFRDRHAERIEHFHEQLNLMENVVGMNMPRVYAVEKKMSDCLKRMDAVETRMDRMPQKQKIIDEQHADDFGGIFTLPLPAQPDLPQPSLTAGLADSAPCSRNRAPETHWQSLTALAFQPQLSLG